MNEVKYKGPSKIILRICTAVNGLMREKQDALTFDKKPVKDSQNPVISDGIYQALIHRDASGNLRVKVDGKEYVLEAKEVVSNG